MTRVNDTTDPWYTRHWTKTQISYTWTEEALSIVASNHHTMWQTYPEVRRELVCGYCNPSTLASACPKEMHGHGVTLVLFGACICVIVGVLSKQAHAMAACLLVVGAMLAKVFGWLSYP